MRSPAGLATYIHTVFCFELNPLMQDNNMQEPFSKITISSFCFKKRKFNRTKER